MGIVLTAVALWLIVTSTTQKSLEIGVLVGIWGVVIAASCVFTNRVHAAANRPADGTGGELALRSKNAVGLADELAERRKFQAQLEQLLRTELRNVLLTEVEGLRAEVADLRNELVDTVGGQLRLERVETTRVIGSNLESMYQQLQRLTADPHESDRHTVDAEIVDDVVTDRAPSTDVDASAPRRRGGRRRAKDADNDVLARILARERGTQESA